MIVLVVNKSKSVFIIAFMFAMMLFGCESDDNKEDEPQAQPTIFQGRVLYSDTNEPVFNARIRIIASESVLFAGDLSIETLDGNLDASAQGTFDITFNADSRIDYFSVSVTIFDDENQNLIIGGSNIGNGMVCSPIGCDDFVPGNEYTDLTILVPKPESN